MLKKAFVAAALTAASGAALAHPPHWAPAHGYRAKHYQPQVRYYYPPAPRVLYYPPAPRVVYRPLPVVPAATVVLPAPGISIRFRLPL